ncbi:2-dehydro-3-deoxygalactonokinase [Loktanella sp. S4079]|uniref:2-dehydro-3-deoxygalactonokinase n=1 Tax=Loktanella sp. S4079 TaxID=579483 RepID=UPI0005F9C4DE|nr:2-dehydro-3-deoxygalactonokinase [Loktanella sp. S4079]KJZ19022.1 2-keto-3-deoxy-galactonokinase [Loktanella sp. S4079]
MTQQTTPPAWIAVDWGTSNLRVSLMYADGTSHCLTSDQGMSSLNPDGFEPALLALIDDHLGTGVTPVVICGMAGSRQGWAEAPYIATPCNPPSLAEAVSVRANDPRIAVSILPGVKQEKPADVMRGEETQIAGYLTQNPDFDGVLCLPGTHSKWVHISAKEIVSFRTFMTGEMFALLTKQSVLRFSVQDEIDLDAFDIAVGDALSRPETVGADLFALRAGTLLGSLSEGAARGRLSGLLIGTELAGARPYWLGRDIALIGAGSLTTLYQRALALQGITAPTVSGEDMVISGLTAAHTQTKV